MGGSFALAEYYGGVMGFYDTVRRGVECWCNVGRRRMAVRGSQGGVKGQIGSASMWKVRNRSGCWKKITCGISIKVDCLLRWARKKRLALERVDISG